MLFLIAEIYIITQLYVSVGATLFLILPLCAYFYFS